MPFRSEAQRRFLFARHPELAKEWTRKYGSQIQKAGASQKPKAKPRPKLKRKVKRRAARPGY